MGRAIVTGGAGFIGTLLARRLLAGPAAAGGAAPAGVAELVLVDLAAPPPDVAADPRVRVVTGDLAADVAELGDADVIFHLAGVPSGAAEADFDLGMHTNIDGTRAVLEYARQHRVPPVLVFSSTLAVFGTDLAAGPAGRADPVRDDTLPRPQSSYGAQKFAAEQFVADYTRKGFVRGRSVRLMTVAVRPGKPNGAASSFMSGIIREPLAGQRAACPVPADTPVALSSPSRTIEGILRAAAVSDAAWGSRTAMNMPGLTTTPRSMAAAMDRVAGYAASDLIDWTDDPAIGAIVRSWPARIETPRARALGLRPDDSFDDIVREYLAGLDSTPVPVTRELPSLTFRGRRLAGRSGVVAWLVVPGSSPGCSRVAAGLAWRILPVVRTGNRGRATPRTARRTGEQRLPQPPAGKPGTLVIRHVFEGMKPGVRATDVSRAGLRRKLLSSALAAADLGWHVFPCAADGKRPALRENWQELATTDPDRVRAWWSRQPYNIGIACGPSGLVVIDLDIDRDAPAGPGPPASGADSLRRLCAEHGERYPGGTYTVDTPSGGCHLYFTAAPGAPVRNTAGRLAPLVDVRADGGYVVGAGSRIDGHGYTARGDFLPLALPLPAWLAALLTEEPAAPAAAPPLPDGAQGRAYALAALREETRRVADARVGTRNDTLNRAAFSLGQLVAAGLLPPLPVMTALADAAAYAGLPEDEARRTIRSGIAAGVRKPRAPAVTG